MRIFLYLNLQAIRGNKNDKSLKYIPQKFEIKRKYLQLYVIFIDNFEFPKNKFM